jgi:hypothetical protein
MAWYRWVEIADTRFWRHPCNIESPGAHSEDMIPADALVKSIFSPEVQALPRRAVRGYPASSGTKLSRTASGFEHDQIGAAAAYAKDFRYRFLL